jgi:hypothetical protein
MAVVLNTVDYSKVPEQGIMWQPDTKWKVLTHEGLGVAHG